MNRAWVAGCAGVLAAGLGASVGIAVRPAAGVPFGAGACLLWAAGARWAWLSVSARVRSRLAWRAPDRAILAGRLDPGAWRRAGQWRRETAR